MAGFIIFALFGLVCGALSWLVVRVAPRFRVWLALILPFLVAYGVLHAATWFAEANVTCAPNPGADCGPTEFVAVMMFAMLCASGAFFGSVIGSWWGWRSAGRAARGAVEA